MKQHNFMILMLSGVLIGSILAHIFLATGAIKKIVGVFITILAGWILIKVVDILIARTLKKFALDKADNLKERKIHTQVIYIRGILYVLVCILTISAIFMQFQVLSTFGKGLLASAGLAGIVLALAAQKSITTLLAGFQVAFTQPIRVDDVVIVEGEWGRIEEITLSYVVVKVWDDRRVILPITYFTDTPFQNWTRTTTRLTGTVFWQVDYTADVDVLRKQLQKIIEKHPKWDKRTALIQVTDTNERTMTLRALVSAKDASDAWDLRCAVREEMIRFLQQKHPDWLPKLRADVNEKEIE